YHHQILVIPLHKDAAGQNLALWYDLGHIFWNWHGNKKILFNILHRGLFVIFLCASVWLTILFIIILVAYGILVSVFTPETMGQENVMLCYHACIAHDYTSEPRHFM
ncbi:hypothetical protein ACJX0J_013002, partial [Zea mays]